MFLHHAWQKGSDKKDRDEGEEGSGKNHEKGWMVILVWCCFVLAVAAYFRIDSNFRFELSIDADIDFRKTMSTQVIKVVCASRFLSMWPLLFPCTNSKDFYCVMQAMAGIICADDNLTLLGYPIQIVRKVAILFLSVLMCVVFLCDLIRNFSLPRREDVCRVRVFVCGVTCA